MQKTASKLYGLDVLHNSDMKLTLRCSSQFGYKFIGAISEREKARTLKMSLDYFAIVGKGFLYEKGGYAD